MYSTSIDLDVNYSPQCDADKKRVHHFVVETEVHEPTYQALTCTRCLPKAPRGVQMKPQNIVYEQDRTIYLVQIKWYQLSPDCAPGIAAWTATVL